MWPEILWAMLPKKYLIGAVGAVLILGTLVGFIAHHQHALKAAYFAKGAAYARDSAAVATLQRLKAQHQADEARADSVYAAARDSSSALVAISRRLDTAPRYTPTIEPLPDSITDVQRLGKVRVIVAATNDTIDDVPRKAAQYWFTSDSVAYAEHQLLARFTVANKGWSDAWTAEHQAREGADSLAAAYATRLRAVELIGDNHGKSLRGYLTTLAFGIAAGAVIHNQIRHR